MSVFGRFDGTIVIVYAPSSVCQCCRWKAVRPEVRAGRSGWAGWARTWLTSRGVGGFSPGGGGAAGRVGWRGEDLADEQGDGVVSAGGALAAVRAAGVGGDVAADQGQHGGERDQARVEAGLPGGARGERGGHVVHPQEGPRFLPGQGDRASAQD